MCEHVPPHRQLVVTGSVSRDSKRNVCCGDSLVRVVRTKRTRRAHAMHRRVIVICSSTYESTSLIRNKMKDDGTTREARRRGRKMIYLSIRRVHGKGDIQGASGTRPHEAAKVASHPALPMNPGLAHARNTQATLARTTRKTTKTNHGPLPRCHSKCIFFSPRNTRRVSQTAHKRWKGVPLTFVFATATSPSPLAFARTPDARSRAFRA